jgi:hypothetical protein
MAHILQKVLMYKYSTVDIAFELALYAPLTVAAE